jgi:hypothetical protein
MRFLGSHNGSKGGFLVLITAPNAHANTRPRKTESQRVPENLFQKPGPERQPENCVPPGAMKMQPRILHFVQDDRGEGWDDIGMTGLSDGLTLFSRQTLDDNLTCAANSGNRTLLS